MLSIDEIEGTLDDEFRDLLATLADAQLERLISDPVALTRLRPASITSRSARTMVRDEMARRARPSPRQDEPPQPLPPEAPEPPPQTAVADPTPKAAEPVRLLTWTRPVALLGPPTPVAIEPPPEPAPEPPPEPVAELPPEAMPPPSADFGWLAASILAVLALLLALLFN